MKHDSPAIGLWTAFCCVNDVKQIETQDDLDWVNDQIDEFGGWSGWPFFDSEAELLADLAACDTETFNDDATPRQKQLAAEYARHS